MQEYLQKKSDTIMSEAMKVIFNDFQDYLSSEQELREVRLIFLKGVYVNRHFWVK